MSCPRVFEAAVDEMGNMTIDTDWEAAVGVGEHVLLACVAVVMGVVGGVGNWLVVVLVARAPTMRPPINLLLASVALCDGLSCTLLLPLELVSLLSRGQLLPRFLCYAHAFLCNVVEVEGVTVLAAVCVDRYLLLVRRRAPLGPLAACRVLVGTWATSVTLALLPHLGVGGRLAPPLPVGLTRCLWVPAAHHTPAHLVYIAARILAVLLLPALLVGICLAAILARRRRNMSKVSGDKGRAVDGYTGVVEIVSGCGRHKASWMSLGEDLHHRTRTLVALGTLCLLALVGRAPLLLTHLVRVMGSRFGWAWFPWLVWWAYFPATVSPLVYTFRINNLRVELQDLCPWLLYLAGRQRCGTSLGTRQSVYMVPRRQLSLAHPPASTSSLSTLQQVNNFPQDPRRPVGHSSTQKEKRLTPETPPRTPHRPALRMWSSCRVGCELPSASSWGHEQHTSI